jgi:hypothetical protein
MDARCFTALSGHPGSPVILLADSVRHDGADEIT